MELEDEADELFDKYFYLTQKRKEVVKKNILSLCYLRSKNR
jgi:hypothetical protein